MFARSGDVVHRSSWVRRPHRFGSNKSKVIQPRVFHLHVTLHKLGGRRQFPLCDVRPHDLQPVAHFPHICDRVTRIPRGLWGVYLPERLHNPDVEMKVCFTAEGDENGGDRGEGSQELPVRRVN